VKVDLRLNLQHAFLKWGERDKPAWVVEISGRPGMAGLSLSFRLESVLLWGKRPGVMRLLVVKRVE